MPAPRESLQAPEDATLESFWGSYILRADCRIRDKVTQTVSFVDEWMSQLRAPRIVPCSIVHSDVCTNPVELSASGPYRLIVELDIMLPDELPVMTLPNVAFFPQALMPLHIFEPRYRQMLRDVLSTNRLFAVAGLNEKLIGLENQFEPPHRVASVGIVRACQENSDGTSNLLLQGLCRIEFVEILTDEPYRRVRIRVLPSQSEKSTEEENVRLRTETARLLRLKQKLGASMPAEITYFIGKVGDPETFVDLAAFSLCDNHSVKQKLLETLNIRERLTMFNRQLRVEIEAIKLHRKLQGGLPDSRINDN
jgi:ATP-dependent Lon protease